MPQKTSAGTCMLTADHTEAVARLASDPAIAGVIGSSAEGFVARQLSARAEGTGHGFVIIDRAEVMGLCTLHNIGHTDGAEVGVWIDLTQRGKGYATFAVGMMLDLAFRNLGQSRVRASVPEGNPGARRVFEKSGFVRRTEQPDGTLVYEVTRQESAEFRNRPAIAALHPSLRTILDAEIAAGNEVVETGGGWPDPDSVFVRLRDRFRPRGSPLPDGVSYSEPDDPHWWRADYTTKSPRHILAC